MDTKQSSKFGSQQEDREHPWITKTVGHLELVGHVVSNEEKNNLLEEK